MGKGGAQASGGRTGGGPTWAWETHWVRWVSGVLPGDYKVRREVREGALKSWSEGRGIVEPRVIPAHCPGCPLAHTVGFSGLGLWETPRSPSISRPQTRGFA